MKRHLAYAMAAVLAACFFTVHFAFAQSSGDIIGRVLDPKGEPVPKAEITLTNQQTGEVRSVTTAPTGEFLFPSVQPGTYSVLVKASGFKELEKKDLVMTGLERVSAGEMRLSLGTVK